MSSTARAKGGIRRCMLVGHCCFLFKSSAGRARVGWPRSFLSGPLCGQSISPFQPRSPGLSQFCISQQRSLRRCSTCSSHGIELRSADVSKDRGAFLAGPRWSSAMRGKLSFNGRPCRSCHSNARADIWKNLSRGHAMFYLILVDPAQTNSWS
nr:hypothetical protein CFP56_71052 [Quercus suber]